MQHLFHPVRSGDHALGASEAGNHGLAIPLQPCRGAGFVSMNAQPPGEYVPMSRHDSRSCYRQCSEAELIQVEKIRTRVADNRAQIILRRVKVLLTFLHPVETKCGGIIFEAV